MSNRAELCLSLLPEDGEPVSRTVLCDALAQQVGEDVSEDEISELIYSLSMDHRVEWIEHGQQVRRGVPGRYAEPPTVIQKERDLEPWFERSLWLNPTMFFDPPPQGLKIMVQNTARNTAGTGRWSRPDICMATLVRYKYQPAPQLSLFTFELKMPSGTEARSVFEALAHTSAGHYPYLVLYLPDQAPEAAHLDGVLDQAQRHGVGVIRIKNHRDTNSHQRLLEARRFEPTQAAIDRLIDERFDRANRLALYRWVRT